MTAILGISAFYHDSAAALVVDGEIMAAAQEERFTRKKHDPEFPAQAIAYCLAEAGLDASQLDYVAFYDKPFTKFDRLLETYLSYAPAGLRSFSLAMPLWLKQKLHLRRIIRTHLDGCRAPLLFMDHHESHAASAFFPSPFDEAAILTLDGVGEWSTTTYGVGTANQLQLTHHVSFPHSLGLLYSAFTYYCGFRVNSGEYKLMGLAPYGRPAYADAIREHLIDIKPDGSFWLNMDYFNYCQGLTMTGPRFHLLFGGAPRAPESPIEPRHMDLAASISSGHRRRDPTHGAARSRTHKDEAPRAGRAAWRSTALRTGACCAKVPSMTCGSSPRPEMPAARSAPHCSCGHQLLEQPRVVTRLDRQHGSLLGPSFNADQVASFLTERGHSTRGWKDESDLLDHVVDQLEAGRIVGWFQDRMEFGPRALGARSILGDPRSPQTRPP